MRAYARAVLVFLLAALVAASPAVFASPASAQLRRQTWHFDVPADYTYSSEVITVNDGANSLAELKRLPDDAFWTAWYTDSRPDQGPEFHASTLDANRNVVTVGSVTATTVAPIQGDLIVGKYDQNGQPLAGWPKLYSDVNFPGQFYHWSEGQDVVVEPDGTITVAGYSIENNIRYASIWRFDSNGNLLSGWPQHTNTGTHAWAMGVVVDTDGNIVCSGACGPNTRENMLLLKYRRDGGQLWARTYNIMAGQNLAYDMIQDSDSNYVVTGYTSPDAPFTSSKCDAVLHKLDTNGNPMTNWPKVWDSGGGLNDEYYAVSQDRNGDYCIVGTCQGTNNPPPVWQSPGKLLVTRYSREGVQLTPSGWPQVYSQDGLRDYSPPDSWRGMVDTAGNMSAAATIQPQADTSVKTVKYTQTAAAFGGFPKTIERAGYMDVTRSSGTDDLDNIYVVGYQAAPGTTAYSTFLTKYPPAPYSTARPAVTTKAGPSYTKLTGFQETLGAGNQGSVAYQLSPDGTTWYYHDGTKWAKATTKYQGNNAVEVNNNISRFPDEAGRGTLAVKAFLVSDGFQKVQLDAVSVDYDNELTWYLAEGSTGTNEYGSFETWILVQNPGSETATAQLYFQTPQGEVTGHKITLAPHTRETRNVSDYVKNEFSVSTRVVSDKPIIAERAMYWTSKQGVYRQAATDSIGITAPATTWYLAEGSTGQNEKGKFETWVLVQNPGSEKADVQLYYQTPSGEITGHHITLNPHTRETRNVADFLPNEFSVSTRVVSDKLIIAERAMYWNQLGGVYREAAHDSIGVTEGAIEWYLAEGSTGTNDNGSFETWILVQNPGSEAATVQLSYQTPAGEVPGQTITVNPHSRETRSVSDILKNEFSVSTHVVSNKPIIAERAMYWTSKQGVYRQAATDCIGVTAAGKNWNLAEGSTGENEYGKFETWILVQNPGTERAEVQLYYETPAGEVTGHRISLNPHTRETRNVGDYLPNEFSVSTRVVSDKPIIAERAMYWNTKQGINRQAAHDSIGSDP